MKSAPILLVAALTLATSLAQGATANPRLERLLDKGWRFVKGDEPGAQAVGFDDAAWSKVSLPHTWNAEDGARGGAYYRGPAWYRLHLPIERKLERKSLFLRFGAASLVAQVYVNGELAGVHEGGFAAFCFDVTKLTHVGDNVLAVRVDNAYNRNVSPLSGDFTVYGGLYRKVKLLALNPVSISPLDDASPGVYLTPTVSSNRALVRAQVVLRNGLGHDVPITLVTTVRDSHGRVVGQGSVNVTIPSLGGTESVADVAIDKPHLWSGVYDPYLYRATVEVRRNADVLDRVEQPFGIRSFRVDPIQGLLLNGKPYDLHGVNIHQGRPSVGWAATAAMQRQDYAMVRELGCTGVRMPHYQHAQNEYALCDKLGLVAWAELALVNRVTPSPEFSANIKRQLSELIKQNYNHPSILFWSMYNEPGIDRKRGDAEWRIVPELVALAHRLDPTRLTTGAVSMGATHWLDWCMDITAFNRYWGWYDGEATLWKTRLPALRQEAAMRSFGMSEYGAGASVHQHQANPPHPKTTSKWHPEEWQALVHETAWPVLQDKPWIWCKFVWVMFDFASSGRNEGDHAGINDKGLVTGDRKTRKDAFYYYKAQWTTPPFVYVTDRRFNPHPAARSDLKVYSNCATVELFVNGKSLGVKTSAARVFVWPGVNLASGRTEVEAVGRSRGKVVRDGVTWTCKAIPSQLSDTP
ncbi:MAG: glycoside hydrolase family 2 protein [Fimbriimonadaceae bacterium]